MFFVESVFLGAFLGLIFDFFKILRLSIKHKNFFVLVEDILFFAISALLTYCFMINVSFGQIRFFIILGELIGFVFYKICFSNILVKFFVFIISIVKRTLCFVFKSVFLKIVLLPIYNIFYNIVFKKVFLRVIKILFWPIVDCLSGCLKKSKVLKILKILLKNRLKIVYNFFKSKKFSV